MPPLKHARRPTNTGSLLDAAASDIAAFCGIDFNQVDVQGQDHWRSMVYQVVIAFTRESAALSNPDAVALIPRVEAFVRKQHEALEQAAGVTGNGRMKK